MALARSGMAKSDCHAHYLDFIMVEGDAVLATIEDDIRDHLAKVGFNVTTHRLTKKAFNAAHQSGDFHLSFSETWGAPYDPHSFASGWIAGDEGHKVAMTNLEAPVTRDGVFQDITKVLEEQLHSQRVIQWKNILNTIHQQAVMLPLWGKRIPTVLNSRLTGYEAGLQQFDYPVHRLEVLSGSNRVTISPGSQTGLFKTVSRLDPHTYRPNEFFANNWVYEGLVTYGQQGQILPALASSWIIDGTSYEFTLRENVQFHDGTPWNCEAAKLNFDHVLAAPLRSPDYHGWYSVPKLVDSWSCREDGVFVVKLKSKFYGFLQDLSFIRPLRMLSPAAFSNGATSDPTSENSCHVGWNDEKTGNVKSDDGAIVCAGVRNISGTGPFAFSSRTPNAQDSSLDDQVVFVRNDNHWAGKHAIEELVIVRHDSAEEVKAALKDKSLDLVWGAGVLSAADLQTLNDEEHLSVFHSDDIQNSMLILNSGKPPLDDISLRKAVIHAIDKTSIIEKELGGVETRADNIFPLDAPYCDVELNPHWDYDLEKARFLNCPVSTTKNENKSGLLIALCSGLGGVCAFLVLAAIYFADRHKKAEARIEELVRADKAVGA